MGKKGYSMDHLVLAGRCPSQAIPVWDAALLLLLLPCCCHVLLAGKSWLPAPHTQPGPAELGLGSAEHCSGPQLLLPVSQILSKSVMFLTYLNYNI